MWSPSCYFSSYTKITAAKQKVFTTNASLQSRKFSQLIKGLKSIKPLHLMVEEARLSDKGNKAYNTITFMPRLLKICQLILNLLGIK
jgi:hypothetical protein